MEESKKQELLKELRSWNLADRITEMPIGENTKAALYFLGKVQDLSQTLYTLHALFYGDADDETSDK